MPNMNTDKACPNLDQYQQLSLGQLSDIEKESLLSHLEYCDACAQKLMTLPEQDTLVALLRQADTLHGAGSKGVIAQLVERLSKMRPEQVPAGAKPQATAPGAPKAENTIDQPPADAAKKPTYEFLAPAQAPDELGRLGPYRVLEMLGTGGMGVVFRAEDPQLARLVALKAMLPGFVASDNARQRFVREAQAAAAIKHDHIVSIYQVGEDRGVLYLAMELLDGEPLDSRLRREGKLPVAEVLRIGRQIALGLAGAHKRGLIHRDIKPANIWLEAETNRVKILDFGLARTTGDQAHLTHQGAIVGTPAYMAPEQGKGQEVDQRCDLFSLGCVLYRMATGRAPFSGTDVVSTLVSVATETPRPPQVLEPGLPMALSELIMSMLAKDAANRPVSAQAVAVALDHIAIGRSSRPTIATGPKKWPVAAGVAAALAFVLLGLWAGGVFRLRTPDGVLVVEVNEANPDVFVDGDKITVTWDKGGKKATIRVKPGTRKVEVKKEGFTAVGEDVEVEDGGRPVFTARLEPLAGAPVPAGDPDRRAADYVLSIGGVIRVNDEVDDIRVAAELPTKAFRLTHVDLGSNQKMRNAGLAVFEGCKHLKLLWLHDTQVKDVGLAYFKDCKNLEFLMLNHTKTTDAGLAHFSGCKNLINLSLFAVQVTDTGLAHFKDSKKLTYVGLGYTQVGDATVALLQNKDLSLLDLEGTRVTDKGMAHLKDRKNLTQLSLGGTKVTDEGLVHFKDCKKLEFLRLHVTQMTDKGLAYFKGCENLRNFDLGQTKITPAGLADLKKALPKCLTNPAVLPIELDPDLSRGSQIRAVHRWNGSCQR